MSQTVSRLLNELRPSRVNAEEIIAGHDLSDKTIVITGGNSGTTCYAVFSTTELILKPILLISAVPTVRPPDTICISI